MNVLHRVVLPAINALLITTVLIYCMFLLIKSDSLELQEPKIYHKLEWVSVPEDPEVKPIVTKVVKPKEVLLAPVISRVLPEPVEDVSDGVGIPIEKVVFSPPTFTPYQSNQLTLVFPYPARYPASQLNRGIEGFVSVGFSVNPVGEVFDTYVIEAQPKGAFEKSALKAIEKFKYKPRYEDGLPVSTPNQNYVFRYEITQD